MIRSTRARALSASLSAVSFLAACDATRPVDTRGAAPGPSSSVSAGAHIDFTPLASSAVCTVAGGDPVNPLVLGGGLAQALIADETQFLMDIPDMQTFNETGPNPFTTIFRVHEVSGNGGVSKTDLTTGVTSVVLQRADWERLDPIVWTPWGTLLFGEEAGAAAFRDPAVPNAVKGLMYELNPTTLAATVRPLLGSKAHEGTAIDDAGNVYGISEDSQGSIFKFVPTTRGDLSAGQLYVLQVTASTGPGTGTGQWVPLDMAQAQVDADVAAHAVNSTTYNRPEDIELTREASGQILYVAVTAEHRVLRIALGNAPSVTEYIKQGVNAPADFEWPDNLESDRAGHIFVAEDPGGSFSGGKTRGDDIWVSVPGPGGNTAASKVVRVASLTDCDAEPTGLLLDKNARNLYLHVQHRGGNGIDMDMAISRSGAAWF